MYKKMRLFSLVLGLISVLLLSACTNSVEFTINFDSNGGSEVSSIKTDGKSSITLPNDPIKDGYTFGGWYWDNNTFNRPFTANSLLEEPISSNMTVYAKWTESIDVLIAHINSNSNNVLNGYKTIRYYTNDAYNTYYDLYVGNTKEIRIQYTTSFRTDGFSFIFMFDLGQITNGNFVGIYPDPIGMKFYELIGHASYNTSTKTVSIVPIPSASSLPSGMYSSSLNLATLCLPDAIEYYKSKVFNPLGITLN
jgi:uncharacterized repeat protein (TIGR02543 family)